MPKLRMYSSSHYVTAKQVADYATKANISLMDAAKLLKNAQPERLQFYNEHTKQWEDIPSVHEYLN